MSLRSAFRVSVLTMTIGLLLAAGASAAPFAGKPAVLDIETTCVTGGKDKGRVFVDVAVRYPDAPKAKGAPRHEVLTALRVRDARGELIATHNDRGRAQVDIPGLRSYVHTHQHGLGKAASARALGGRPCGAGSLGRVQVQVNASQRLVRRGAAAQVSAASAQGASASTAETITGVKEAPLNANGCVFDSEGLMDCAGAFLQKVSFVGETVAYANFAFANLLGADFSGVRMGHAQLNQAVLDQADLSGALLGSASLTSASLLGTDLTGAVAPYANFAVAKFVGAKLQGANLTGANLAETSFESSSCDANTIIPGNFGFACTSNTIFKK